MARITGKVDDAIGADSSLVVLQYNATPPTLTNGQFVNVQCDANSRLLTASALSGNGNTAHVTTNNELQVAARFEAKNPATYAPNHADDTVVRFLPIDKGTGALLVYGRNLTTTDNVTVNGSTGDRTNRNGTTSGTANTWSQVMAVNTSRKYWAIQNPPDSGVNLQIGLGAASSEYIYRVLSPGGSHEEHRASHNLTTERISIRCVTTASVVFYASEA